jgi:hypothetical protein
LGTNRIRNVYGKYEGAPFLNWAKKFLAPNAIIIDSGANIGQMLMYLAQEHSDYGYSMTELP